METFLFEPNDHSTRKYPTVNHLKDNPYMYSFIGSIDDGEKVEKGDIVIVSHLLPKYVVTDHPQQGACGSKWFAVVKKILLEDQ